MKKTDDSLEHAAAREFLEETTIDMSYTKFRQIKTYSHRFDPRMRIIDTAFSVRISAHDMNKACGSDDAIDAKWFDLDNLPFIGFHHNVIIDDWMKQNKEI